MSVFMPVPFSFYYYSSVVELDIRDGGISRSFIVQDYFSYPEFFVLPYEVEYSSFKVCKELCWDFNGNYIKPVRLLLVKWPFFTMLILLIHEHERSSYLLISSLISFFKDLKFLSLVIQDFNSTQISISN